MTQTDIILSYFKKNSNRDIPHAEVVDWVTEEYKKIFGKPLRDPDRAIRKLAQSGQLIKIAKGVYKFDPEYVENRNLEDFSTKDKIFILKRDGYKCVVCGKGKKDGIELHVDHIKPKDLGGKASVENGQTLCAQHNFMKKNLKQTETGKKMFIRLYELAKETNDSDVQKFCEAILQTFENFNMNGHIEWKK